MALLTQEYPPAPGGMNVAQAPQEIDDTEARYLQDILLDYAGIARRRGPIQPLTDVAVLPRPATNLATTIDPAGTSRFAALTGTVANGYLTVWNAALSATSDLTWAFPLPTDPVGDAATAYRLSSITPALQGGSFIGTASDYGTSLAGASQACALWRGGVSPDYSTGTVTFTRGSATVTGAGTSWTANVTPGMFLFANTDDAGAGTFTATYIGTVYSITSDTVLVLEKTSPYSGSAGRSYSLTALRGTTPKVVKGRITCDVGGTVVSGGNTKFASQGMGTGTWNMYRQRDNAWIGKVSAVPSDISITLAANAAIAMADELYVAIRGDWATADKSTDISGAASKLGWLTAVYAERQWYGANNTSFDKTFRLWFSDTGDVEAVDISDDGDWIPISSTTEAPEAIRALCPTYNALLVMKDTETFAVYGNSPESFSAKKLEDDGTLSTMSVQPYGGGAIWAGRNGIYFYDGVQNINMTLGKFGATYKNSVRTFDPLRYRMWSMVVQDHYFLHIEKLTPTINITKGNVTDSPDHWTMCINMDSRAFTIMKDLRFRGAITLPADQGRDVWYVVNGQGEDQGTDTGYVVDAGLLFSDEALDTVITDTSVTNTVNIIRNPSFEVDLMYSGGINGGVTTRDTVEAYSGEASLKCVTDGSVNTMGFYHSPDSAVPITENTDYAVQMRVKRTAGSGELWWSVYVFDAGGVVLNGSQPVIFDQWTPTGEWEHITGTFTSPPTAAKFLIYCYNPLQTASTFYVDAIQVEEGEMTDFIDGDMLYGHWDGTPYNSSTSRDTPGPDFFYETKKFNAGEDIRLKRIRQVAAHYLAQGGDIMIDTVIGLNDVGSTLGGTFPASVYTWDTLRLAVETWDALALEYPNWVGLIQGVFRPKKVGFMKKGHHIAFRFYQSNSEMIRVRLGPQQIGYKPMRPSRV